ncbi:hypothetical protein RHS01_06584 [Rhizoctonia solani]|uniref:NEDD8-conjugating enzyme UBC12 n=1 Tax=Rhizoctonia solani TaxID=456999 RepID=A0A8H7I9F9_9AGAM|nr:hypothetical protein RHS01_06584 [Rhizoctonia solani]
MIKIWSMKKNEDAAAKKKPKTSAAQLRVQKDITELDLPKTMELNFPNPEDTLNFTLSIKPDEAGMYKDAEFKFSFSINTNYPHEPPKVKCIPKIYHPNVDLEGNVCLNILREDWKPVLNLNSIMVGLQYLFLEPNADDPLNKGSLLYHSQCLGVDVYGISEAAEELRKNRDAFIANVKRSMQGRTINGALIWLIALVPRHSAPHSHKHHDRAELSATATSIASRPPSLFGIKPLLLHEYNTAGLKDMSSPHSPVSEHERRSTDSDKQPHQADGLHRSHHIDSGLDVSEDANQGKHEPIMPTPRMRSFRSYDRQESAKPSPSTVSIPISVTPEKEYTYAEESVGTSSPTPKPYTKPTVIPVSVALTVNTDVGPESGIESPSQTDSAAPKTPTPDSAPPRTPVPNEPATSGSSPQKPPKAHRYVKSAGPSMLEKLNLSVYLHINSDPDPTWLATRRATKKARAGATPVARERAVEDSLHIWKREVVPNWKEAIRKPYIRQMWWRGIPTRLRGEMWIKAIGNGLAISKDSYKRCLARANRALTSGSFPVETLAIIEEDIRVTLPGLHIFTPETGPLYSDLKDLLCAWVVSRSDEGLGYVKGVSSMAGMFLINMSSDDAFVCMRNLLERHCMRSFYGGPSAKDDIEAYYRIFDTLLADGVPKGLRPDLDVIILEGDSFLYRAALAIIAVIEPRLFFPDRKELMEVLRGENRAALEVAKRSGLQVDQSARYEQYGMNEEVLWAEIMGMDEWWKDSTWSRLIQRELPDV